MYKKRKTTHNVHIVANLDHFCHRWYRDVWVTIEDMLLTLALNDDQVLFNLRLTCRHWAYHKLLYEAAMRRALENRVSDFRRVLPVTFSGFLASFLENEEGECLPYMIVSKKEPAVTSDIYTNGIMPGFDQMIALTEVLFLFEAARVLTRHRSSRLIFKDFGPTWARHLRKYYDCLPQTSEAVKETVLDFLLDYYDVFSHYEYQCSACPTFSCMLVPNTPSPDSSNKKP